MSLFATKPIEAPDANQPMKRVLGPIDLTLLGIGAIIGTGIFVLTGQAAAAHAGPAVVLSMIVAGVASGLAAICYSEFASSVPVAGSAYTYGYATLGELVAWIIGWDLVLEYALGAATVAVGWSAYVVSFLKDIGIQFPPLAQRRARDRGDSRGWIERDGALQSAGDAGLGRGDAAADRRHSGIRARQRRHRRGQGDGRAAHHRPGRDVHLDRELASLHSAQRRRFGEFGWSGVMRGAGVIFFAYIGFDAVSTAAQESKNPQRDMPRGIIGSLIICTILYVLVSGVMVGLVPYQQLGVPAPMALAVDAARVKAAGSSWQSLLDLMPFVVKLGAIMGLSSTIIVQMMAQPRIFFAMGKDGLLPAWASTIHPRFRTPHVTTLITGAIVMLASGFTAIDVLGELVSIGTLFAFVIVSIGVIVLRRTRPDLPRPFKTPFVPALPIASALVSTGADGRAAVVHLGATDYLDGDRAGDLLRVRKIALETWNPTELEPGTRNQEPGTGSALPLVLLYHRHLQGPFAIEIERADVQRQR